MYLYTKITALTLINEYIILVRSELSFSGWLGEVNSPQWQLTRIFRDTIFLGVKRLQFLFWSFHRDCIPEFVEVFGWSFEVTAAYMNSPSYHAYTVYGLGLLLKNWDKTEPSQYTQHPKFFFKVKNSQCFGDKSTDPSSFNRLLCWHDKCIGYVQ